MLEKSGDKVKPINSSKSYTTLTRKSSKTKTQIFSHKCPSLITYLKKVRFLKSQILSITNMSYLLEAP